MTWTAAIVIALVVAMVVGPVSMLRPSPAQRRREKLRLAARRRGLHVRFERLRKRATDTEKPATLPVYTLAHKSTEQWLLMRTCYAHESHIQNWWQFYGPERPRALVAEALEYILPQLPSDVAAVSADSRGFGLFWRETGDEQVLDIFVQVLSDLAKSAPQQ